jgi:hypothetical protein
VVKTGTSIITFLIVFLIQQCQNKATIAFLLRLNELIAANKRGSNRLIDIEDLDAKELQQLKVLYGVARPCGERERSLRVSFAERSPGDSERKKINTTGICTTQNKINTHNYENKSVSHLIVACISYNVSKLRSIRRYF